MISDLIGAAGIFLIALANLWKWGQENGGRDDLIVGILFFAFAGALLLAGVRPR
jgi:hypothetical protein